MAALDTLIEKISDPDLRAQMQAEVKRLNKQKKFGLVWENHIPEATVLYDVPVKRNKWVMKRDGNIKELYYVQKVQDGMAECIKEDTHETENLPIDSLVCVARFGDPIYPYLKPIDTVCNAPDSDLWHTLIEADNYHALQLLEYLYAGKVDCIYIDPPYNTGAKDWKYNNDYVDENDSYRHSKWLSMMEKRLRLAKKLLNPKNSVLIITIDVNEYLHLGCLLEEIFPKNEGDSTNNYMGRCKTQMITSVINPSGVPMKNQFSRAEEYIFFVFIGCANVIPCKTDMLHPAEEDKEVRWASLLRSGNNSAREARPNLYYPLFFSKETGKLVSVGKSLKIDENPNEIDTPEDCFVVWPKKQNGTDGTWQLQQQTLLEKMRNGFAKYGPWNKGNTFRTISYLAEGTEKALLDGQIEVIGKDEDGFYITGKSSKPIVPLTVWNQPTHGAGDHGSSFLLSIFKRKTFTFPKSIYAVEDTLRFIIGKKKNALILDFFAGSGTTLHAVNMLNAEDDGHRRCIMVTNNEVSNDEAAALTRQGYHNGDPEWEKLGIAHYVTWPRTVCTIKGHDVNGNPLTGNYIDSDRPMADGFKANAAFFKLGFLDKTEISIGKRFNEMLPVMWMKAGAKGKCPEPTEENIGYLILPENGFAVLNNTALYNEFAEKVNENEQIKTVFIVTGSEMAYRDMIAGMKVKDTYQLYRDYLDNFRINAGR